MYRRTVPYETRIPSFTSSSDAIRSSPHVRFAAAISAINCRRSAGTRGRPCGRDFHRQNKRNPLRCQRMSVFGLTTVMSWRQSISRDNAMSVSRVASSARRGLTCRSRYNATACAGTDSRRRVARVSATGTKRTAGRRRRRNGSCGERRGNGTGSYRPMVRPQGSQRLILFKSTWARRFAAFVNSP